MVVALGILSAVSTIHATGTGEVDASKDALDKPFAPDANVSLRLPLQISESENLSLGAVTQSSTGDGGKESASELNRKLTNPVSSI